VEGLNRLLRPVLRQIRLQLLRAALTPRTHCNRNARFESDCAGAESIAPTQSSSMTVIGFPAAAG
jgi:hypothetical protein